MTERLAAEAFGTALLDGDQLAEFAKLLAPELARAMRELPDPELKLRGDPQPEAEEWVSATALAARLGVSVDWVYCHADELDVLRLGDGPKARLRFNPQRAAQAMSASVGVNGSAPAQAPPPAAKSPRRRRATRAGAERVPELLAIRGQAE